MFALNILACENAASSDVCNFYTFRPGPDIWYLNVKFLLLLLHTPLINPAVLTLGLDQGPRINYRAIITQMYLHIHYI